MTPLRRSLISALALTALVGLAYANHFENSFHFDDWHAIHGNPYITTLSNAGRFFVDGMTFSSLPSHHGYRPLLSLTFAIDYAAAGGLAPAAFHIDSFIWFVVLVLGVWLLARELFGTGWLALFLSAAWAVHPALAETVNYIVQRGDIIAAVGCVWPIWLYARKPRVIGWHLLVFVIACFAKPSAVVFPALLFLYVYLYMKGSFRERVIQAITQSLPAFVLAALFFTLQKAFSPPTAETGARSSLWYWATQPYALLHEVRMFFWPTQLTADTDMPWVEKWASAQFLIGALFLIAFLALLCVAKVKSCSDVRYRPIAFGLGWFIIANAPTSLIPLAEITNDHRMFAPFIGLAFALGGALRFLPFRPDWRVLAVAAGVLLAAQVNGTWMRNRVWKNEESLWRDVTEKSPNNGRGLMNYGLSLMSKGQLKESLVYYERAHAMLPNYPYLETNLGIVKGLLGGQDEQAEKHFKRAVSLLREPVAQPFYARFLRLRQRDEDAKAVLKDGLRRQADHWDMRLALLILLEETQQYGELRAWLKETHEMFPSRRELDRFFNALAEGAKMANALAARNDLSTLERCELGRLRYMQADYAQALATVAPILQATRDELCAVRVKAQASAGLDDWGTALKESERALTLAPASDEYGRAMRALQAEAKLRTGP